MRRFKRAIRTSFLIMGWGSVVRALISILVFVVTLWFIYLLMGIFEVVEEMAIGVPVFLAISTTFILTVIFTAITNEPTRNAKFKISTNPTTHRNLGQNGDGLPSLTNELTWWRATIYLESDEPTTVSNLKLIIKGKRYCAHDFKPIKLEGSQDVDFQGYTFAIPSKTVFGKQKAEIIAITQRDDYGGGTITLKG